MTVYYIITLKNNWIAIKLYLQLCTVQENNGMAISGIADVSLGANDTLLARTLYQLYY